MSVGILSAGLKIGYATGTTRPTSGYTYLPEVKDIPQSTTEASTHQVTDFNEMYQHVSIGGLLGEPGNIQITMNRNDTAVTAWEKMLSTFEEMTAGTKMYFTITFEEMTAGTKMYFTIEHPSLSDADFFSGKPYPLSTIGGSVDSPLEMTGTIAVESSFELADRATTS